MGFFSKKETEKEILCSMCKMYKPIHSDMGDEFCFTCLVERYKSVIPGKYSYADKSSKVKKEDKPKEEFKYICHPDLDKYGW